MYKITKQEKSLTKLKLHEYAANHVQRKKETQNYTYGVQQ